MCGACVLVMVYEAQVCVMVYEAQAYVKIVSGCEYGCEGEMDCLCNLRRAHRDCVKWCGAVSVM